MQAGDQLSSHDGQWVTVEAVTDLREVATVYNLRVRDYHTYFVGSREWDFSVWAHNANYEWFVHDGVVYLRFEGQIIRTPYTRGNIAARMEGQTLTQIQPPAGFVAPPRTGIRNQHLAGRNHDRSGVPFDRDGFPVFDSTFDATIPANLRGPTITDGAQFRDATRQLRQAIEQNPALRQNFTQAQLDAIAQGAEQIPGFTWHHYQDGVTLQLVDELTHAITGHTGSRYLTGGRPN